MPRWQSQDKCAGLEIHAQKDTRKPVVACDHLGSNPNLGEHIFHTKNIKSAQKNKMPEEKKKPTEEEKPAEGKQEKPAEGKQEKPAEDKQEKQEKPSKEKPVKTNASEDKDFRHRVRVAGVILDGNHEISQAMTKIKGVGTRTSRIVLTQLGYPKGTKIGSLNEKEIEKIEDTISNLGNIAPAWMVNRQKDAATGENKHVTGPDLDMGNREDITKQKRIKSYRGIRHAQGLPCRGQRTRSTFRKGATLGVVRKKAQPALKK